MSPTLLLASNPAALRRVLETGGISLADGVRNLLHDLKQGRLSMVDTAAFAPGRNLALSPGKVVYRNKLIELIQYEPHGKMVHRIPLLILPPWINKYYILDLQPKNSMVRHLVDQGFTVFMVSWRNPDALMEDTGIEDYLDLGPLAASDVVRDITGSPTVNVVGYCIGGTLLAMTLAWLAARQDSRFSAVTFIVSLLDFAKVGDTAVFLGEPTSVDFIEQQMMQRGYLDSRKMSNMFNLLRSNDLIWSNVVNNYLLGQKPPAFDLLYWNADGTRMARAAHSWYLRNTYMENNLIIPGRIQLNGEALDLGRISQHIYAAGAERDHIVPWDAAWQISRLVAGKVRYVLARAATSRASSTRLAAGAPTGRTTPGLPRRPSNGVSVPSDTRGAGGRTGLLGLRPIPGRRSRRRPWAVRRTRHYRTRRGATCWRSSGERGRAKCIAARRCCAATAWFDAQRNSA
jgi:polyhydroxyalkanoate synthase